MWTRLTMYWSVQTRTCINIPCEVPNLEEERTFTFLMGTTIVCLPVTRWRDLPGHPCSELSYWSWSNTEVAGELGMRPWRISVPRVLRVTEKLNNTGSVDDKFLIVKSRYATHRLQVQIRGRPDHTLFMNLSMQATMYFSSLLLNITIVKLKHGLHVFIPPLTLVCMSYWLLLLLLAVVAQSVVQCCYCSWSVLWRPAPQHSALSLCLVLEQYQLLKYCWQYCHQSGYWRRLFGYCSHDSSPFHLSPRRY